MTSSDELTNVPPDFPRDAETASVAGVQPKLAAIRDAASGNYVAHRDNEEVQARFAVCEDLAEQLADKCTRNRNGKYRHLSEREILDQLLKRLLTSGWGNPAEMGWTVRQTANKLGWAWSPGQLP
jgi:hypothetical protein